MGACAIDGDNACWYDAKADTLKCSFQDYGPTTGVTAYAVNYSGNPYRVSVFGQLKTQTGTHDFCCVVDGDDYDGHVAAVSLGGTSFGDSMAFVYETHQLEAGAGRAAELRGGAGNDTLRGSDCYDPMYKETYYGDADDDTIEGGNGPGVFYGGDGEDKLYGLAFADIMFGGAGDDEMYAGQGVNELRGQRGHDTMEGKGLLFGGSGNDTILCWGGDCLGQGGNDSLTIPSRRGNGRLHGGAGADSLSNFGDRASVLHGGYGVDDIRGGDGNDVICESAMATATLPLTMFSDPQFIRGMGGTYDVLDYREAGWPVRIEGDRSIDEIWVNVLPSFDYQTSPTATPLMDVFSGQQQTYDVRPQHPECVSIVDDYGW